MEIRAFKDPFQMRLIKPNPWVVVLLKIDSRGVCGGGK